MNYESGRRSSRLFVNVVINSIDFIFSLDERGLKIGEGLERGEENDRETS